MTRFSFPHLPPITKNFYIKVWVHTHTRSYMYVYILISQTRKLRLNDFSNITQLFSGKNGDRNKFFYICSVFPFFSFCFDICCQVSFFFFFFAIRFLSYYCEEDVLRQLPTLWTGGLQKGLLLTPNSIPFHESLLLSGPQAEWGHGEGYRTAWRHILTETSSVPFNNHLLSSNLCQALGKQRWISLSLFKSHEGKKRYISK